MIVSHRHKFIFIKTEKTAGTSIEIALSKFCGPEDIVTRISSKDEKTRKALGGCGPQNDKLSFSSYSPEQIIRLKPWRNPNRLFNHIDALALQEHVGFNIWDEYFTFCFERNPWDKMISWYYWKTQEPRPTLSEFLDSPVASSIRGRSLYTNKNNKILVDKIFRFEDIDNAMKDIAHRLKLPELPELPNAKSGHRKDKRSYREVFSSSDRLRVESIFAWEIKNLDYTW